MLTEIGAGFTAAASKMGLFTAAKQVDTTATVAQTTATNAANVATKGLTASMLLNPYVLVAAAVGSMVYALYKLSSANKDVELTTKLSNQASRDSISAISGELSAADKLSKQLKDETLTRAEKVKKVKEFQAAYPGLLQNQNLEAMSIDQINKQLEQNIGLLRLQAKAKAIQSMREDEFKKQLNAQTKTAEEHMSTWDKFAEGGIFGFFMETDYNEKTGIGAQNRQKIIDESQKKILYDSGLKIIDIQSMLALIAKKDSPEKIQ
jgi:hypothetical protein